MSHSLAVHFHSMPHWPCGGGSADVHRFRGMWFVFESTKVHRVMAVSLPFISDLKKVGCIQCSRCPDFTNVRPQISHSALKFAPPCAADPRDAAPSFFLSEDDIESIIKVPILFFLRSFVSLLSVRWDQVFFLTKSSSFISPLPAARSDFLSQQSGEMMTLGEPTSRGHGKQAYLPTFSHSDEVRMIRHTGTRLQWMILACFHIHSHSELRGTINHPKSTLSESKNKAYSRVVTALWPLS